MKNLLLHALFFSVVFSACEKTEKVDNFPKHQSKLVTNCFFGPDTSFLFKLFKSLSPIDNAPFKELNNTKAYIKIFENNILFDSLTYNPNLKTTFFTGDSSKRPRPNNTYRFECYYPGFGIVKAEDYLPDSVVVQKIKGYYTVISSYSSNDSIIEGELNTVMNIDFNHSGQYLVVTINQYNINPFSSNYYGYSTFNLNDLNNANESDYINSKLFVSNPSGVKSLNLKWDNYFGSIYKNKPTFQYEIIISSCSKNAFEYLKRHALQIENNDDPFSQPTPISNNIINGYGIFGGMNTSRRIISF